MYRDETHFHSKGRLSTEVLGVGTYVHVFHLVEYRNGTMEGLVSLYI